MPHELTSRKSSHEPLCETPEGTGNTSWFFGNSKHESRRCYGMIDQRESDGVLATMASRSERRKAASALIAEIPFELAQHIARVFKP